MPPPGADDMPLVRLSCVEDDAQGEMMELLWGAEIDTAIVGGDLWSRIGGDKFDDAATFAAYLNPNYG